MSKVVCGASAQGADHRSDSTDEWCVSIFTATLLSSSLKASITVASVGYLRPVHLDRSWPSGRPSPEVVESVIPQIRLLSKNEMKQLFPDATVIAVLSTKIAKSIGIRLHRKAPES